MMNMKKFTYLWIVVLFEVLPLSCSNFLEEFDQDKFVPNKAEHFAALMLREFNYDPGLSVIFQFMTDEVAETTSENIAPAENRASLKPLYTWQKDIEVTEEGLLVSNNNRAWQYLYRRVAIMNYIIEEIEKAEGTPEAIAFAKGEAYFIRAYCYFLLTNLYAEPYESAEHARITYGVPLRTDIGVSPTYDKNMLNECYNLIESDLAEARRLIEQSGITNKSMYHPSVKACDLLMSTIKLYKKEYPEVIDAATKVINGSSLMKLTGAMESGLFITTLNPEVLYSFSRLESTPNEAIFRNHALVVSPGLYDSYHESDLRKKVYFYEAIFDYGDRIEVFVYPRKGQTSFSQMGLNNLRVAEAYLNRAEAYAFTNQHDNARADLRTLLAMRYLDASNIQIPTDNAQLIAFIFQERFKELCFEVHHRWFDLRRMGPTWRPEIVRQFTIADRNGSVQGVEFFTLLKNDRNYTLSVPKAEKENNPFIFDYERFDKMSEINETSTF